jgi:NADPH-dependent 2,4-dienoyl-CoA reductase/sulfur reductase-like enzyme
VARTFASQLAELIAAAHRDHGVDRNVGRKVEVNEGASRLDDGTLFDADLVVVGIGVAPRFGLAQAAASPSMVDEISPPAPDIFAAGTSLAGLIATAADAFALSTG